MALPDIGGPIVHHMIESISGCQFYLRDDRTDDMSYSMFMTASNGLEQLITFKMDQVSAIESMIRAVTGDVCLECGCFISGPENSCMENPEGTDVCACEDPLILLPDLTNLPQLALEAEIRKRLVEGMTDADRLDFFNLMTEGFCKHCGGEAGCQCWNDE